MIVPKNQSAATLEARKKPSRRPTAYVKPFGRSACLKPRGVNSLEAASTAALARPPRGSPAFAWKSAARLPGLGLDNVVGLAVKS
jgi:hypothetical protein